MGLLKREDMVEFCENVNWHGHRHGQGMDLDASAVTDFGPQHKPQTLEPCS